MPANAQGTGARARVCASPCDYSFAKVASTKSVGWYLVADLEAENDDLGTLFIEDLRLEYTSGIF